MHAAYRGLHDQAVRSIALLERIQDFTKETGVLRSEQVQYLIDNKFFSRAHRGGKKYFMGEQIVATDSYDPSVTAKEDVGAAISSDNLMTNPKSKDSAKDIAIIAPDSANLSGAEKAIAEAKERELAEKQILEDELKNGILEKDELADFDQELRLARGTKLAPATMSQLLLQAPNGDVLAVPVSDLPEDELNPDPVKQGADGGDEPATGKPIHRIHSIRGPDTVSEYLSNAALHQDSLLVNLANGMGTVVSHEAGSKDLWRKRRAWTEMELQALQMEKEMVVSI